MKSKCILVLQWQAFEFVIIWYSNKKEPTHQCRVIEGVFKMLTIKIFNLDFLINNFNLKQTLLFILSLNKKVYLTNLGLKL